MSMHESNQTLATSAERIAISEHDQGSSASVGSVPFHLSENECTVTVLERLSDLPARFEPLFASASDESVFHTLPWYRNFVHTVVAPNERLRIFAVESKADTPGPLAVLVMCYSVEASGAFGSRALKGLANYYTSLFGPVIDPQRSDLQPIFNVLARAIARDNLRWGTVDLHPLSRQEPYFSGLVEAFRKAGFSVQSYFCAGNWYLNVDRRTYLEYLETRPSRISKTAKRTRRILETGGHFRYELYTGLDKLDQACDDYEKVYRSSWKVPEPYPRFIPGLARTCAEQGWLRLGIAYMDGEPAAAQVWIVVGRQAFIYKMAYDERFAKQSVGTVLTSLLMEHVIQVDKVAVVDYLTGDDNYKRDWMSDRRERWGILAFNLRTAHGLLAAARHIGGRSVKRVLDRVRTPQTAKA